MSSHRDWPKRKIVETSEEVLGQDPYTGKDVVVTFDFLECGHKRKRGAWKTAGRTFETPNTNRHCEPCYREGRP